MFQPIYFGKEGFCCKNKDSKSEIYYLLKIDEEQISIFCSDKESWLREKKLAILQSPGYGLVLSNDFTDSEGL